MKGLPEQFFPHEKTEKKAEVGKTQSKTWVLSFTGF